MRQETTMPHVCWICGDEAPNKEELLDHMHEAHKEGSDYLRCPECNLFLKDLIVHYQCMHPGLPLPTGVPLRVQTKLIDRNDLWRKEQRKKKKRSRFKQGFFESTKNGKQLHYRSGWEKEVYKILERAFSVKSYKGEPFAIPYMVRGLKKNYWPDILVKFTDDTILLVEVKPLSQCPDKDGICDNFEQTKNDAKWQAAEKLCQKRGWFFVVWTERAIKQLSRLESNRLTRSELLKGTDAEEDEVEVLEEDLEILDTWDPEGED
jgi:DNA-directed RNA polymerase subunit RPC12/RpoP